MKDLGLFLEVERLQISDGEEISEVKKEIKNFLDSLNLNLSSELKMGKPELMIKKFSNK